MPTTRAAIAIALALTLSACGRILVFAKIHDDIAPRVTAAGRCPLEEKAPADSIDALIEAGDRARDKIPRPVYVPPTTGLSESELREAVSTEKGKVQAFVDEAYKNWRNAHACYEAVARLDPSTSYAFLNMGFIALKMADLVTEPASRSDFLTRAQTNLSRARELNRFDGQAVYYEAELQVRRENYAQAEKLLLGLLDKKWNRGNVHNLLGYVYLREDKGAAARAEWTAASQLDFPAESTDWAMSALRPATKKKFESSDDDAEPKGYYRWDMTTHKLTPISPPEIPCGWAAAGRPRC